MEEYGRKAKERGIKNLAERKLSAKPNEKIKNYENITNTPNWSGRRDSNSRPSEPHSDALARLRYAPTDFLAVSPPPTGLIIQFLRMEASFFLI